MLKGIFLMCFVLGLTMNSFSQSGGFQAKGYYYKAKQYFESKDYSNAIVYALKSKESLNGTNEQLEYLHIMACVKLADYTNANKELKRFYNLIDFNNPSSEKSKYFDGKVERLTTEEENELAKVMIDIQEKAEYVQSPQGQKEQLLSQIDKLLKEIIDPQWKGYTNDKCKDLSAWAYQFEYKNNNGFYRVNQERTFNNNLNYVRTQSFSISDIQSVRLNESKGIVGDELNNCTDEMFLRYQISFYFKKGLVGQNSFSGSNGMEERIFKLVDVIPLKISLSEIQIISKIDQLNSLIGKYNNL